APHDLVFPEKISLFGAMTAGERAELASLHARVREVDVPVDDVGHALAGLTRAQRVGRHAQRVERRPARATKRDRSREIELVPFEASLEDGANVAVDTAERGLERLRRFGHGALVCSICSA